MVLVKNKSDTEAVALTTNKTAPNTKELYRLMVEEVGEKAYNLVHRINIFAKY